MTETLRHKKARFFQRFKAALQKSKQIAKSCLARNG
jgi:hypothetical protein